jgi:hypothetical protein
VTQGTLPSHRLHGKDPSGPHLKEGSPTEPLQDASEVCSINGGLVHLLWNYTPSYRALGWRELSSGDDAWTGILLGGVLWALFPRPVRLRWPTPRSGRGAGAPHSSPTRGQPLGDHSVTMATLRRARGALLSCD